MTWSFNYFVVPASRFSWEWLEEVLFKYKKLVNSDKSLHIHF